MTDKPLTDEELAALLPADGALAWSAPAWATFSIASGQECVFGCGGRAPRLGRERSGDEGHRPACPLVRLVAEVRRLRSEVAELRDEWELQERTIGTLDDNCKHLRSEIHAILRKHRDGKT